jgi:hypothetical protein
MLLDDEESARKSARRRQQQPEAAIQRAVFQHIQLRGAHGVFAFHAANGGARRSIEAAILKGLGVVAGVPDIMVIKGGKAYGLELKAPGGQLSEAQRAAHEALRTAGAEVATVDNLDDALRQLEAWCLLRGKAS